MFDTYVSRNINERITENVVVHEHRAPTDESVKILNELTQKALDNIVATFSTSNNTLQVTGAVYDDHRLQEKIFLCKLVLNGKDFKLQVEIGSWECKTEKEMIQKLYDRICEKLAKEVLQPLLFEMKNSLKYV